MGLRELVYVVPSLGRHKGCSDYGVLLAVNPGSVNLLLKLPILTQNIFWCQNSGMEVDDSCDCGGLSEKEGAPAFMLHNVTAVDLWAR